MTRLVLASTVAICVFTVGLLSASAAKFNKKVDIGDKPNAWENLKGVDGKTHSLADYKKADVVVIAFTCNHCPVANAYETRFNEFAKRFKDKKVELIAINVS
ncbi:MAG: redoxin domain-containing protein, partial [Planctomycetaceae bacterium]|nr:redoxin domain-containing protein [Planctomycetaceae bacterium]